MSLITDHILTWVTFLPLLGSVLLWTIVKRDSHARVFALCVALADFVLSLHLWFNFDSGRGDDQFVEKVAWLIFRKYDFITYLCALISLHYSISRHALNKYLSSIYLCSISFEDDLWWNDYVEAHACKGLQSNSVVFGSIPSVCLYTSSDQGLRGSADWFTPNIYDPD